MIHNYFCDFDVFEPMRIGLQFFLQLHNNFLHLQIWSNFWFQTFKSPQKQPPRTIFHVFSRFWIFFNFITNFVVSVLPAPDSPLTKIDCDAFLSLIPWNLIFASFLRFWRKIVILERKSWFLIRFLQKSGSENPFSKFEFGLWKP